MAFLIDWPALPIGVAFVFAGAYSYAKVENIARDMRDVFLDGPQKRKFERNTPQIQPLLEGFDASFSPSSWRSGGVLLIIFGLIAIYGAFAPHSY